MASNHRTDKAEGDDQQIYLHYITIVPYVFSKDFKCICTVCKVQGDERDILVFYNQIKVVKIFMSEYKTEKLGLQGAKNQFLIFEKKTLGYPFFQFW